MKFVSDLQPFEPLNTLEQQFQICHHFSDHTNNQQLIYCHSRNFPQINISAVIFFHCDRIFKHDQNVKKLATFIFGGNVFWVNDIRVNVIESLENKQRQIKLNDNIHLQVMLYKHQIPFLYANIKQDWVFVSMLIGFESS